MQIRHILKAKEEILPKVNKKEVVDKKQFNGNFCLADLKREKAIKKDNE